MRGPPALVQITLRLPLAGATLSQRERIMAAESPHARPTLSPWEFTRNFLVVHTDLQGRITYVNRAYLEYMGPRAPSVGSFSLDAVVPEDRPRVVKAVEAALSNPGQAFWVEFSKPILKRPWSRSRWEFVAVCDPQGNPQGIQCVGYDISDVYRRERFQEASTRLLSLGLRENLTPEEGLRQALELALTVVPAAQAGSATLLGPDGNFHFVATRGYDLAALEGVYLNPAEPLSLSQHIQAKVFTQADLARFNARIDPQRRELLLGPGRAGEIQAVLATPVVVGGRARAYLYLDQFEQVEAFDALDLRHMEGLAYHVGWLLYGEELRQESHFNRYHDPRSGLPNLLDLRKALSEGSAAPRALLALRCRSLERIHRLQGEETWVASLRDLAEALRAGLRRSDRLAFEDGVFWLLLEGVEGRQELRRMLKRLQSAVRARMEARWPQLEFSPQVGVALAQPGLPPSELIGSARSALEQSPRPGLHFHDPRSLEEDALRQALHQALRPLRHGGRPRGFSLYHQPIVSLTDRRLHHLEALLRWTHPERGPVSPGIFLPIVEEEGWMPALGAWILRMAARQAARWGVPVAVNLSGSQLEPSLPRRVAAYIESYRLSPQQLIFEVTEGVVLEEDRLSTLQALAQQGHPLHLDDFGSGMSSLERITRLPLAAIKPGQGFMANLGPTPSNEAPEARLLRVLRGLGQSLGLEVIVEGIETAAQLEFLVAEGFTLGQGYLLGRPALYSEAEIRNFLEGVEGN